MTKEYPSDWDTRRNEVYNRDEYTCQNCGVRGGPVGDAELHAHHIVPKSKGGTHKKSNLKTLCKECHNAIHGNSMAPSDTNTQSDYSSSLSFPLSESNYPYAVSDEVNLGNHLVQSVETIELIANHLEELAKHAKLFATLDDEDETNQLQAAFSEAKESVNRELGSFEEHVMATRDITPSETSNNYGKLFDEASEFIDKVRSYRDLSIRVKDTRTIENIDIADLDVISSDVENTAEKYIDTVEDIVANLLKIIRDEISHIEEKSKPFANRPDYCPVCGESINNRNFTYFDGDVTIAVSRCDDCRTEWAASPSNMEVVSSPYDIEGLQVVPDALKAGYEEGYRLPANREQYNKLSNRYNSAKSKVVISTIVLSLVATGMAYVLGSLLLFIGAILLILLISQHMLTQWVPQQIRTDKM
ncbi:HNH endonuclease [Salarchaeum sp. III]|uniref:HNH endonuclease n=1 Tax=Salarchaeum sp. III TaxID=3107927 RepID=UPI002ED89E77